MCEVKVESEGATSKPASQYEDIIDGFAFVSFACEGELKVRDSSFPVCFNTGSMFIIFNSAVFLKSLDLYLTKSLTTNV